MTQLTSFPKSEIKILLLENVHPVATDAFHAEGFQVEAIKGAVSEAELAERVRDVHILGIRSKTQVTPRVLDEARRMLAVGAFCIGTNQVALAHASRGGVPVFNAPFSNTRSVAELILAEVVMLSRHLGDRSREVHEGRWRKV
ncbi:MAG: phosphoglycerate dehydrogenase, partial [Myxococcales bacterium]|nr:phosphoglycerate dehydrogenase [Myxococcales bacterium]